MKKNAEEEEITSKKKRENFNAVPHLLHKNKCDDACIHVYTNCLWNLGLNENNVFVAFESLNKKRRIYFCRRNASNYSKCLAVFSL